MVTRSATAGRVGRVSFALLRWIPFLIAVACRPGDAPRATAHSRIVSLAPSTTELLFAIGAGDRVVGRTRWGKDPPEALAVPDVGDGLAPNVEAVAAQRPDLVVLYRSPSNATAVRQLENLGIETLSFSMDRLDDVAIGARLLGDLAGVGSRAHSMADAFARQLDSARALPGPARRLRALILAWDQPPIVIGAGSFQTELVTLAGGENVFADIVQPSGQVSIETIAARDPEVVLLTSGTSDPAWASRPEWQVIAAVRERRFVVVSGTEFSYPSFRSLDAVRELRRTLAEWTR